MIEIDGETFDPTITHFTFSTSRKLGNPESLAKLREFPNLESVTLASVGLGDRALAVLGKVSSITNLNISENVFTDAGIAELAGLTRLKYLRMKGNEGITDACTQHLARLVSLEDLQIQETPITDAGLPALKGLSRLRQLVVWRTSRNFSYEALEALSLELPECTILVKGNGEFLAGNFDGKWRD